MPEAAAAPAQPSTPPTTEGSTGQPPALPELDRATLLQLLDKHSDDPEFRKELSGRRVIGGIAGDLAGRQRLQEQQEAARKAIEETHADMRKQAADDPLAFAQTWLQKDDVDTIRRQQAGLRDVTRREFAGMIGAALRDLPEFSELTAADTDALSKELAGIPEDQVVGAFVKKATDIVADKRATKRTEAELTKRLAEEKKAWAREQADKRQQARPTPRTAAPPSRSAEDTAVPDWRSPEFDAWYQQNVLGKRPAASRR